jgi:DnaJ like chaperone protein
MSWWGKVVGGAFGFMMGGPLGAIFGAALGNYFDDGLDGVRLDDSLGRGNTERVQSVFFATTFSVMGYLAKSDGHVSRDEIAMAERVMQQMQLSGQQRKVAINLFNQGKQDGFPLQDVLRQFKAEVSRRRNLVQMFLEIQVATAVADGSLHDSERRILEQVSLELGYTQAQFNDLLNRLTGHAHFADQQSTAERLSAAYELLGVDVSASDAEIKKAYRRQMNQHHPDKLVAKGLPEEMIELATEKTQDIKAAYELIKQQRSSQ